MVCIIRKVFVNMKLEEGRKSYDNIRYRASHINFPPTVIMSGICLYISLDNSFSASAPKWMSKFSLKSDVFKSLRVSVLKYKLRWGHRFVFHYINCHIVMLLPMVRAIYLILPVDYVSNFISFYSLKLPNNQLAILFCFLFFFLLLKSQKRINFRLGSLHPSNECSVCN